MGGGGGGGFLTLGARDQSSVFGGFALQGVQVDGIPWYYRGLNNFLYDFGDSLI